MDTENKGSIFLKSALAVGCLIASEQAYADINISVDLLGQDRVNVIISEDALVSDLKTQVYEYLKTHKPSIAEQYNPATSTQNLYYDTDTTMGLLSNDTQVPGAGKTYVLSLSTLENSEKLTNTSASNKAFSHLTAANGGAFEVNNGTSINIDNTTFVKNNATENGGAIYATNGALEINDSNFLGNTSTQNGGAIYNSINTSITNSSFRDNVSGTSGGAVYNTGSLNIFAKGSDVVFANNKANSISNAIYNTGTVNLNADSTGSITFNDKISGNNGIINITGGKITFNDTVSDNTVNLDDGELILGKTDTAAPTISNLNLNGGKLNTANNNIDENVVIASMKENTDIKLDIDFAELIEETDISKSDKFSISEVTEGKSITISDYNAISDLSESTGKIKISDNPINVAASTVIHSGIGGYTFGASTDGVVNVTQKNITTLNNALTVGGTVSYILTADETLSSSLPTMTNSTMLIDGQGHTVNGNSLSGMTITSGKKLNIKNITFDKFTRSSEGTIIKSNNGIINITNSTISNSTNSSQSMLYLSGGTLNIDESNFIKNSITGYGGVLYNVSSGNMKIKNSLFKNNSTTNCGGVMENYSATAEFTNTTFDSNTASTNGGALYNSNTNISNLTIIDSTFTGNKTTSGSGGAIYNTVGTITVKDTYFTGNTAKTYGGAIWTGGTANITDTIFNTNSAQSNGGAIYNSGTVNIKNSTFTGNSANTYGGALAATASTNIDNSKFTGNSANSWGGAIYAKGNTKITNSIFDSNKGGSGAAIINDEGGNLTIENSVFTNQVSTGNGGAVYFYGTGTVKGSEFTNNTATSSSMSGGAIAAGNANLTIQDYIDGSTIKHTTFTNNSTTKSGGAINLSSTTATITNAIFTGNKVTAGNGGAINNDNSVTTITNSQFLNNTASSYGGAINNNKTLNIYATNGNTTFSGNKANGLSNAIYNTNTINMVATNQNDYILFNDAINGSSGTINIGKDTNSLGKVIFNEAVSGNTVNLYSGTLKLGKDDVGAKSISTLKLNGGILDIANNVIETINVNSLTNNLGLGLDVDFATLTSGISASDKLNITSITSGKTISFKNINILSNLATETGQIKISDKAINTNSYQYLSNKNNSYTFAASTTGTINVTKLGTMTLKEALTIGGDVKFNIDKDEEVAEDLGVMTDDSLLITSKDGSFNINGNNHAGITVNADTSLTVNNIGSIEDETVKASVRNFKGTDGGFINNSGTVNFKNSVFSNNSVTEKGGVVYNNNNLVASDNTFANNSSTDGGAIYNNSDFTSTNDTFQNNTATNNGGGIYNAGNLTTDNSSLSTNTAANGGGIYNAGNLTVDNSSLIANTAANGGGIYNATDATANISNTSFTNNTATTAGGAIYNAGILNITATDTQTIFSGNKIDNGIEEISNAIHNTKTVNLTTTGTGNILFKDGISGENGTINIAGNVTFDDAVIGNTVNLNSGKLSLGQDGKAAKTVNNLTLNAGTLDIANNVIDNKVIIDTITDNVNLELDLDLANLIGDTGISKSDMISVTNMAEGKSISLTQVNILSDLTTTTGKIQISETPINITGTKLITAGVGGYDIGSSDTGIVDISKIATKTLREAMVLGGDVRYNMTANENITSALGSVTDTSLIVDGQNQYNIIASNVNGFSVGSGKSLTLQNTTLKTFAGRSGAAITNSGTIKLSNTVIDNNSRTQSSGSYTYYASMSAGAIYTSGTTTIENSTISNNKATLSIGSYSIGNSAQGGAMWTSGNNVISDSIFTNNTTSITNSGYTYQAQYARGGAIFHNSGNLTIEDSIFSNNKATSSGTNMNSQGGAIYINSGTVNIKNSTFASNSTTQTGGAIYMNAGTLNITDTTFNSNTATSYTGAVYVNSGILTIDKTLFENNTGATSEGAVVSKSSNANISNSTFRNNIAKNGNTGALYNNGTLKLSNNIFTSNSATQSGGALRTVGGTLTLENNNTFTSNKAANGGAISIESGTLLDTNSIYTNNIATTNGGAIYNISSATITNSMFKDNTATTNGGAIYNTKTVNIYATNGNTTFSGNKVGSTSNAIYNQGTLNLIATNKDDYILFNDKINGSNGTINIGQNANALGEVIFNESVSNNTINLYSGTLQLGQNDVAAPSISTFNLKGGTLSLENNIIDSAVTINSLTEKSALILDVDLKNLIESTTISKSDMVVLNNVTSGKTLYIKSINTITDIETGETAYIKVAENSSSIIASAEYDNTSGGYTFSKEDSGLIKIEKLGAVSLKKALETSGIITYNISADENVEEDLGTMATSDMTITSTNNKANINGNNHLGITIEANKTIDIQNIGSLDETGSTKAAIKNFKGTDGGFINNKGKTNINNSVFDNNLATNNGGLLYNTNTASLINSTITNSSAGKSGGAIYTTNNFTSQNNTYKSNKAKNSGGTIYNTQTLASNNDTFENNSANEGGAIYSTNSLTTKNNTYKGNSTKKSGGAIYNSKTLTSTNDIFEENSSDKIAGAIYNADKATTTLSTATFRKNTATEIGGAIYNDGTLTLTSGTNTFEENSADEGGAIYNSVSANITANFTNNSSTSYGGAIYNDGTVTLSSSTFKNNSSENGGAIFNSSSGTGTISSITFDGNNATLYGGAIDNNSTLTITNSNFINNTAEKGGAIYNTGTLNLTQTTFSNNSATKVGGAIYNSNSGTINLKTNNNSTLTYGSNNMGTEPNIASNFIYNSGTVHITTTGTSSSMVFNDAIGGILGTININKDNTAAGTVVVNNSITGQGAVNFYNGTLQLGSKANPSVEGSENIGAPEISKLNIYGGTVNLVNNVIDNVEINSVTGTLNLMLDVDLASITKEGYSLSDSIKGSFTEGTLVNIKDINLQSITNTATKIKLSDVGIITTEYRYLVETEDEGRQITFTFLASDVSDNGYVTIACENPTLHDFIRAKESNLTFNLIQDEEVNTDLGALVSNNLTVQNTTDGENYSINGNGYNGITIASGKKITFNNIGSTNDKNEITSSINGFKNEEGNGSFINNAGTTIITKSIIANNSAKNGGAIYNTNTTTLTDTSFINNTAGNLGGAIYNTGTLNISTSNNNIKFSGNTAGGSANSIYNTGTINLSGTKTITFEDDITASGGTFNVNSGTVKVNSITGFDTIYANGGNLIISDTISANDIYIQSGTLTLGTDHAISVNNIYMQGGYGGTLDIANNEIENFTINTYDSYLYNVNFGIDINIDNKIADKFTMYNPYGEVYGVDQLNISNANIMGTKDIDSDYISVQIFDNVYYYPYSGTFSLTVDSPVADSPYKYLITNESDGSQSILVQKIQKYSLVNAFHLGEDTTFSYTMIGNETVTDSFGTMTTKDLTVDGTSKKYTITANNINPITIGSEKTLTMQNVKLSGFKDGDGMYGPPAGGNIFYNSGTLNLDNVNFPSDTYLYNDATTSNPIITNYASGTMNLNKIQINNLYIEEYTYEGTFDISAIISNTGYASISNSTITGCNVTANGYNFSGNLNMISNSGTMIISDSNISNNYTYAYSWGGSAVVSSATINNSGDLTLENTKIQSNSSGITNTGTLNITKNSSINSNTVEGYQTHDKAIILNNAGNVTISDSTINSNNVGMYGENSSNLSVIQNSDNGTMRIENSNIQNNTIGLYSNYGSNFSIISNNNSNMDIVGSTISGNRGEPYEATDFSIIYNTGTLNITDSTISNNNLNITDPTQCSTLYNNATTNIIAKDGDVIFSNNKINENLSDIYNSNTLNLDASKNRSISFTGTIIGTSGTININKNSSSEGTVTFNNEVTNNTVNLYNGTLKLGTTTAAPSIETLNIKGGTLNIANGTMDSGVSISSIATDVVLNLSFDVNLVNGEGSTSDKISGNIEGRKVSFDNLNFISDLEDGQSTTIKLADVGITTDDTVVYSNNANMRYTFAKSTTGIIDVSAQKVTIVDYIREDQKEELTYTLRNVEIAEENLGTLVPTTFTINSISNSFNINGKNLYSGIIVPNTNQTLNINNIGSLDADGNITASITGFTTTEDGAFVNNNGTTNITNSVFSNNTAKNGGAISNAGTTNTTNASFVSNTASNNGGAIINSGTLDISSSLFKGNNAQNGGAIYSSSESETASEINETTFKNNTATNGGSIYNNDGILNITNSSFTENIATENGGAIYNATDGTVNIIADATNLTFSGNRTGTEGSYKDNSIYNAGTLNLITKNEADTITFSDTITGTNGTININKDVDTAGTIIINNNISGQNAVNFYNGTLKIDDALTTPAITNLNIINGTLDIQNNSIGSVNIHSVTGTLKVKLDINLEDGTIDKLTGDFAAGTKVDFSDYKLINEIDNGTRTLKLSEVGITTDEIKIIKTDKNIKYVFHASTVEDNGNVLFEASKAVLYDYVSTNQENLTYTLTTDENVEQDLGTLASSSLLITGNNDFSINGNNHKGITIEEGKTLTINNIGTTTDPIKSINGFKNEDGEGGFIKNAGTLNITNSVINDNSAKTGGAIYNEGIANIYANSGTTSFKGNTASEESNAIYNTGTLNLVAKTDTDNIIFDDAISGNEGTINITAENLGTVNFNQNVTNNNVNLYNGTLKLGNSSAAPTISNLTVFGGTIDINNNIADTLSIASVKNDFSLKFDVDFENETNDKLNITEYNGKTISIDSINLLSKLSKDNTTVKLADVGIITTSYTVSTPLDDTYDYLFKASTIDDNGEITVIRGLKDGLYKAITTAGTTSYLLTSNEQNINNIGNMAESTFTIDGGTEKYGIIGNGLTGITVENGKTLTIQNTGYLDASGNAQNPITDFGNSQNDYGFVKNAGTLNITNSVFANNNAPIYNTGTANITDSAFINNTSQSGSTAGIHNKGTLNITANTSDVLFSGNTLKTSLNALYNDGGTINLSAVTGKTITFKDAITANNGTLNANSGTISATKISGFNNINVKSGNLIITNSISANQININGGKLSLGIDNSASANKIYFNSGTLDTANNTIENTNLYALSSSGANFEFDINLDKQTSDKFIANYTPYGYQEPLYIENFNISNANLIATEDIKTDSISVQIFDYIEGGYGSTPYVKMVDSPIEGSIYKYALVSDPYNYGISTLQVNKVLKEDIVYDMHQGEDETITHTMIMNEKIYENFGTMTTKELTVDGTDKKYSVIGTSANTSTITDGHTLTMKNLNMSGFFRYSPYDDGYSISSIFVNSGNLNLDNVTITGTYISEYGYNTFDTVIKNTTGTLNIENSTIQSNYISREMSDKVITISNDSGTVNIINTQIINNGTTDIYSGYGINNNSIIYNNSGNMNITGSTIKNNQYSCYEYIDDSATTNNTIIYNNTGNLKIEDSTISNNSTNNIKAKAILYNNGTTDIVDTTIKDNSISALDNDAYSTVYNNATMNITALNKDVVFSNNKVNDTLSDIYNTKTVNLNSYDTHSISFSGAIKGNGTDSELNINTQDEAIGTVVFNNTITGNTININKGTVQFGKGFNYTENNPTININGNGEININNNSLNTLSISSIQDSVTSLTLDFDVDLKTVTDSISGSDKFVGSALAGKSITIGNVNFITNLSNGESTNIKLSDSIFTTNACSIFSSTSAQKYDFAAADASGIIKVTASAVGLYDYLKSEQTELTYHLIANENITKDLGEQNPNTFTITSSNNTLNINGNEHSGIIVDTDKTLNITNIGSVDTDNSVQASINGFKNTNDGGFITSAGTLNITNSVLYNNQAKNGGAVNITDSSDAINLITDAFFVQNNASENGGAINITNESDEANIISNSTFNKNTATNNGGAINNNGLLNIQKGTFEENQAKDGGAIYITNESATASTISDSTFNKNTATNNGGAINNNGLLNIQKGIFEENQAKDGGAIYITNESATANTISDSTFTSNIATNNGGAISSPDLLNSSKNTFKENTATNGGSISNNGTFTSTQDVFEKNTATNGGAIHTGATASTTTTNTNFKNNIASVNGGAIISNNKLDVNGGTFDSNEALNGGAIYASETSTNTVNATFKKNSATDGGAIYNKGSLTIANSSYEKNTSTNGAAIYNNSEVEKTIIISSTSFTNNSATNGGAIYNSSGEITLSSGVTFSNNIASSNGGAIYNDKDGTVNIIADGYGVTFDGNKTGTKDAYKNNAIHNIGVLNLNAKTETDSIAFNDSITGSDGTININNITGNSGSLIINNEISGQKDVNLYNGTIILSEDNTTAYNISNLNIIGNITSNPTLDIQNNVIDSSYNIKSISGIINMEIDVDLATILGDGKTSASDSFIINSVSDDTIISLSKINIMSDLEEFSGQIIISDKAVKSTEATFYRGSNKYIFKESTTGIIKVFKDVAQGLKEAMNEGKEDVVYILTHDEEVTSNLDNMTDTKLTIKKDGNYSINGNEQSGIIIEKGQTLVIDNIGSKDSTGKITSAIQEFKNTINGGFIDNNAGTIQVSSSIMRNNVSERLGGAIYNSADGTLTLDGDNTFVANYDSEGKNDITNDGSLTISGNSSFDGGIKGAGTTVISKDSSIDISSGELTQNDLILESNSSLLANTVNTNNINNAGNITINDELTTNEINGNGNITLSDSETEPGVKAEISGTLNQNTVTIGTNASLTANGGNIKNINSNGKLKNNGVMSVDDISGNGTIENTNSLTVNNDLAAKSISNDKDILVNKDINASKITNNNSSTITVKGNIESDNITNNGTINTNGSLSTTQLTNNSSASITSKKDIFVKNNINNTGKIIAKGNLTTGQITNNTGGQIEISGDTKVSYISSNGIINIKGNLTATNTIDNNNTLNLSGTSVVKEITGTGTLTLGENVLLDVSQGKLEQSLVSFANNTKLNINNANKENLNIYIQADTKVTAAIDFNDKFNTETSTLDGTINIYCIDLTESHAGETNSLPNEFASHVELNDSFFIITGDEVKGIAINKGIDTTTMTAGSNKLSDSINISSDNNLVIYNMDYNESIAPASDLGGNKNKSFTLYGNGNTVKDGSIIVNSGTEFTSVDTNYSNSKTASPDAQAAITVKGNATLDLIAQDHDISMINTDNKIAISLTCDDIKEEYSTVNLVAKDGRTIKISDDIVSDNKSNIVNFNGGTIEFSGTFDPVTANVNSGTVVRSGYDDEITYNLNGGTLKYEKDNYLYQTQLHDGHTYNLNSINFNGGTLDLRNYAANTIQLNQMTINSSSNLYLDADLKNQKIDNFGKTPVIVADNANLNIAGINLVSDATSTQTSINFTKDKNLKTATKYTGQNGISYSPIYKYDVKYDSTSGNFNFTRSAEPYNPAIYAAPVAAQLGGYLNQLNSYDEAFHNMDMTMLMTTAERKALKYGNKFAAIEGNESNLIGYEKPEIEATKGVWFKPYTTIEKVGLSGGPNVNNTLYGGLVGGDSNLISLKHGWDMMYSLYAGYNGSSQRYDGVSLYQNGGLLGANAIFYRNNFFTGLTANFGASNVEASTMYGTDNFAMLNTGIASKTGYNFEFFNGKFIVQPNFLMSYSFVNTFNYTTKAGVEISSNPLHAMQIVPGLKLIGNLPKGWQPYLGLQFAWNLMDKTSYMANDVALPNLSVDPYIQYGVGVQKRWGEKCTGSLQAVIRNGGRNGVAFSAGFKYSLGKDGPKQASTQGIKTQQRTINLDTTRALSTTQ